MTRAARLGVLFSALLYLPTSLAVAQERKAVVPRSLDSSTYAEDLDSEVGAAFERAFGFNPLTEERLRIIQRSEIPVRNLSSFSATVEAGKLAVENPTDVAYEKEFVRRLDALLESSPGTNIMAMLFVVFRESITDQNEDKRYLLKRLEERNEISEALNDHLEDLESPARQLEKTADMKKEEEAARLEVQKVQTRTKDEINAEIATVEADQETLRNQRQAIATQLENANKISDQYISMLSRVLKTMDEMRKGSLRNLR